LVHKANLKNNTS